MKEFERCSHALCAELMTRLMAITDEPARYAKIDSMYRAGAPIFPCKKHGTCHEKHEECFIKYQKDFAEETDRHIAEVTAIANSPDYKGDDTAIEAMKSLGVIKVKETK